MAYQALLFCPDEKTARTVTQVLSELDFEVCSCTEPFGAVKKLMAEHFDAVVVDCDNEQNATLLFKSARNSQSNQSALAVAVVEGQVGVAKAFRIGANLVLTKPINVEQAKGTLRVARGLLRKNDSAKAATPAAAGTVKPASSAPAPAKPVLVNPSAPAARPAAPAASPSIAAPKQVPQYSSAASASSAIAESAESTESHLGTSTPSPTGAMQTGWGKIEPLAAAKPKPEATFSKPDAATPPSAKFSVAPSAGAASAPAPAREPEAIVSTSDKKSPAIPASAAPEIEPPVDKVAVSSLSAIVSSSPAPTLTFGGTVGTDEEPSHGGSKKLLIAVAAIVLVAVGAYVAWTKFGSSTGTSAPVSVAVKPAAVAAAPQTTPSSIPSSAVSTPAVAPAIPGSTATAPPTSTASPSSPARKTSDADKGQGRLSDTKPESSKAAAPTVEQDAVAANKVPAKPSVTPIVIKKIASQPGSAKVVPTDAPMPSITGIAPAGNGGPLPNLMDGASTAPTPVLQTVNVSQGVSQGLVLKKTTPTYPANALRMHVEGSVQLLATVSKRGDISAVKVLSGDPSLARAAADAVKQWKYKPYLLDGSPVEIQTQVTVNFKLPR